MEGVPSFQTIHSDKALSHGRSDTEPTQQSWLRRRDLPTFQINQIHIQPKETTPKNPRLIAIKNFNRVNRGVNAIILQPY